MGPPRLLIYDPLAKFPEDQPSGIARNGGQKQIFDNQQDLASALIDRTGRNLTALLVIYSKEDMRQLLNLKNLFRDVGLVMVLWDRNTEVKDMALSLRPRYWTFHEGDFSEVTAVLAKLLAKDREMDGGRRNTSRGQKEAVDGGK